MTIAEFLVELLIEYGVTDVFGIPGGVVLDFLYALERREGITPHLSYHEQASAFEACGYAQVNHNLGVAYATRGPGFTNLITGIADAYADSLPVLFITGHTGQVVGHSVRFEKEQEMDTVSMVKNITKYARAVDNLNDVCESIQVAYRSAMSARKGPVFLDFSAELWNKEINPTEPVELNNNKFYDDAVKIVVNALKQVKRPVVLVGDGVRQSNSIRLFDIIAKKSVIPIISSRCSQDVGAVSSNYYGYIGSHGIRYSNFIFAKSDFVISLGNRLGFPVDSKSFSEVLYNKKIIRIDVDKRELERNIINTENIYCDINAFLNGLLKADVPKRKYYSWLSVCEKLKEKLAEYDKNEVINQLIDVFKNLDKNVTICCDVGNNEFWVSRAYTESGIKNRILYSKSFGALGCGIPKAIGAFYASHSPILCIVGDQGLQMNIQELQVLASENLKICLLVINNYSSGMIKSRQKLKYNKYYVHTTMESGYIVPDIEAISAAYGIPYRREVEYPSLVELKVNENIDLAPSLPAGNKCKDMSPMIDRNLYKELNNL